MILARVAVAKSSRSAASSEDLSGTFYRACRKTAPRTGAVSSLSDLCSPHDAYAPCPLLAEQRLASHRLRPNQVFKLGYGSPWSSGTFHQGGCGSLFQSEKHSQKCRQS